MATTGEFAASVLSVDRHGRQHRSSSGQKSPGTPLAPIPSPSQAPDPVVGTSLDRTASTSNSEGYGQTVKGKSATNERQKSASDHTSITDQGATDAELMEPFDNGYHFPPKYSWQESTKQGLITAWKFSTTFWGFFWVLYGLNVVAWGGMLFLLLCNASKAMCYPTCNDINSPRRKWIETDSQILNGLFCVTGFGLAPWRFRDWYYLLKYRVLKDEEAWRRLAGLKSDWFRLEGSEVLPLDVGPGNIPEDVPLSSVPYPIEKIPDPPLTGVRAPPTAPWKMDFFIWTMIGNTFLQAVLSGFMWGLNRYDRPSWSTGLFVALACIIAAVGGIVSFIESKKVKSIEGVPLSNQDKEKLARDREQGILHYNNIKDKKPKEKVADEEAGGEKPSKAKKVLGLGQT
ncbi:hypothetical protein CONLIGDRAFT_568443 [Coniochaeta ligniaria NRRL 30616]|uniref:Uncharacterized protein n=1 Tax=Coniochaeta ligniaria NRRL 30616 TaxID=1408157 RepID=A0A1J7J1Q5_9PEZI|nr:hypothetical protein CONLIGDRAFT_568443 [Coniochaeta ligniaria NRRL 30616]